MRLTRSTPGMVWSQFPISTSAKELLKAHLVGRRLGRSLGGQTIAKQFAGFLDHLFNPMSVMGGRIQLVDQGGKLGVGFRVFQIDRRVLLGFWVGFQTLQYPIWSFDGFMAFWASGSS